jgi:hypothetical protein
VYAREMLVCEVHACVRGARLYCKMHVYEVYAVGAVYEIYGDFVWEIFDFGTGRYGPQKHHHVLTVDLHLLSSVSHKTQA